MLNVKWVALIFRLTAIGLTIWALLLNTGLYGADLSRLRFVDAVHPFLYYTEQSCVFVLVMFIVLAICTFVSLWDRDKADACFYPRLQGYVVVYIALNFGVFWTLLSREYTFAELLLYRNNGVHGAVPLLMFADYFLFCNGGHLKKNDPYYFTIVPLSYFVFATIIGFMGVTYHTGDGGTRNFPYWFLDYHEQGWMVAVYVIVICIVYVGLGKLLYAIDRKRKKGLYDKTVTFFFGGKQ